MSRPSPAVPSARRWAAGCLTVLLSVAGCGTARGSQPAHDPAPAVVTGEPLPVRPAEERVLRLAVLGDSLTAGAGGTLEGALGHGTGSWLPAAVGDPVELVGGWAVSGAKTADMRAGVEPVDADVLVVLAGTNDVLGDVPWERTREDLLAAVATAGVLRVLLVAIPPNDRVPGAATDLDALLLDLANEQGWQHLDPWVGIAAADGTFAPGTSDDGIHPTQAAADVVGGRIRAALVDLAEE